MGHDTSDLEGNGHVYFLEFKEGEFKTMCCCYGTVVVNLSVNVTNGSVSTLDGISTTFTGGQLVQL